jgi:hypothetical protein
MYLVNMYDSEREREFNILIYNYSSYFIISSFIVLGIIIGCQLNIY